MNEDDLLEQLKQLKDKMAPLQEELYIVRLKKRAGGVSVWRIFS